MTAEFRLRNQAGQLYNRGLTQQWRGYPEIYMPSLWLIREPDLEQKMLRDPEIAHAVGYRQSLIAGKRWTLIPKDETNPVAKLAVAVGTDILGHIKKFTEARRNLARAFFSGSRFARIHGCYKRERFGDGKERIWWIPTRLEDVDAFRYRKVADRSGSNKLEGAHWEGWDIGKGDWVKQTYADALTTIHHVYQDDEAHFGYGRALREALAWPWYSKTHIYEEYLQYIERFGQGTLHAKVDGLRDGDTGLPNEELHRKWQEEIANMRARHVLVSDRDDELEIIDASGTGHEVFTQALDRAANIIFTLVMGANLTTSANEGGSYALAEIQENSTEALVQFDRQSLEETITDDLVRCIWIKNVENMRSLGIENEMPDFSISQEKRQDPAERARVAMMLNRMGAPVAADDLYEQLGFRKPEKGDDIIRGQQDPQQMGMGMPGMGAGLGSDVRMPGMGGVDEGDGMPDFNFSAQDQPRDTDGKWTDGAGSSGSSKAGFLGSGAHWSDWQGSGLPGTMQKKLEKAVEGVSRRIEKALAKVSEKGLGYEDAEDLLDAANNLGDQYDTVASLWGESEPSDDAVEELSDRFDAASDALTEMAVDGLANLFGRNHMRRNKIQGILGKARLKELAAKFGGFDPNQPRNRVGEWTDSGSGGGGVKSGSTSDPKLALEKGKNDDALAKFDDYLAGDRSINKIVGAIQEAVKNDDMDTAKALNDMLKETLAKDRAARGVGVSEDDPEARGLRDEAISQAVAKQAREYRRAVAAEVDKVAEKAEKIAGAEANRFAAYHEALSEGFDKVYVEPRSVTPENAKQVAKETTALAKKMDRALARLDPVEAKLRDLEAHYVGVNPDHFAEALTLDNMDDEAAGRAALVQQVDEHTPGELQRVSDAVEQARSGYDEKAQELRYLSRKLKASAAAAQKVLKGE